MRCLRNLILLFVLLTAGLYASSVHAASTDDLYVAIGQALSAVASEDRTALNQAIDQLGQVATDLPEQQTAISEAVKQVDAKRSAPFPEVRQQLTTLSATVRKQEEAAKPKTDPVAKAKVKQLLVLTEEMRQVKASDRPAAEQRLLTAWASHESLVRNDSVGHYGNIEMALASIRIAAAREPADTKEWTAALDQFDAAVQSFLDGEQVQAKKTGLQSLLTPLEEAQTALATNDLPKAKQSLEAFLKTWPRAEGEVRTRNEGLYSKLESDMPLLLARLTPETRETTAQELESFENAIAQLQTKTHYTFVDAMLVMLREGLEALLIVSALVAFARKSQSKQEGKVWAGAGLGLIASGLLALILQTVFKASFAATGREQIEGYTGIVAVVVMLFVGYWLHSKSAVAKRKHFLSTLSTTSLFFVSFLTIFREGAETLLFYIGMAPAMTKTALLSGIALAILIIGLVSYAVIQIGVRLPIHRLFQVASWLIYLMAFKILGTSLHALQLTNVLPIHPINGLGTVGWLGFYPTLETLLPQVVLIVLIALFTMWQKRRAASILTAA
ncbi:FTR1 family iron permease [Exiguobacterium acetylicum]|uniref:FTR1 family iron permease n=1 Tax=Exiguobacterium acetylicum TaxID=41170 RepID=UPI001EE34A1D|nr:FTR1 family protein [Exiguobacterium acetylicum]UKS57668.1 FTR1 family iron permease [Exiguobacterium acetylicum]